LRTEYAETRCRASASFQQSNDGTLARFEVVMITIRLLARAHRTLWPRAAAVMIAGTVALLTAASTVEAQQGYQTPDEAGRGARQRRPS
jgi:hypothetical protein